ncbi:MAG: acetyl/propionyl/methylcrotonyl-CoA carboxylase subunit alpha [Burkholderiaceae bacterium]
MFSKILIANRGEIACRIIDSAHRLGVLTVAVYSDADVAARHVQMADEAVAIGPAPARESYLVGERIIAAAKATGAQAIHPGYGFLSENDGFAQMCAENDIVFIGPPVAAIRAMGLKAQSKALMAAAGVPLTPGYHGRDQSPALLSAEAQKIGYPVLIKASAGGGGKGMRLVESADQFDTALASCQREASAAFGNSDVLVEKYIVKPRHIEVQVFGDQHGNAVHLFERDCSVQRRHQKVLEEAPAPGMTPERRAAMGKAAVDAALAVQYVGAGTVEFIVDQQGDFYFMEMNTRLQVEHPVTEMITGQDLVQWQLQVAAGEPLPLFQEQLSISGHALEARIYAEDPARNFLPSTGQLSHLRFPSDQAETRIDTGVREGDTISPHYDPMIAKLIVWGADRATALARMRSALAATEIVGVRNNVGFLSTLIKTRSFAQADLDTGLIERESDALFGRPVASQLSESVRLIVAAELFHEQSTARKGRAGSPWDLGDSWRLNLPASRQVDIVVDGQEIAVRADYLAHGYRLSHDGHQCVVRVSVDSDHDPALLRFSLNGGQVCARIVRHGAERHLFHGSLRQLASVTDRLASVAVEDDGAGTLTAPMPGKLIALSAEPGVKLKRGSPLLVMEAMKMEHTINAPSDGTVTAFRYAVGDQVDEGVILVDFEAS